MRLVVRSHQVLGPHGATVRMRVFCPSEGRSRDFDQCRTCPSNATFPSTPGDPDSYVECAASEAALPAAAAPSTDVRGLAGRDTPVGALAGPRLLCVQAELPVERLALAFREWSGVELPVVDAQGHLLGTVWREDFVRARSRRDARTERVGEHLDQATVLRETSSIEHAVEILTGSRARTLILVGADHTVEGVLTDLELLRWLTRERRRRLTEAAS